jgi:hypothetical protein
MLKMTKMEFEFLTDYDKVLMLEKGIRSGMWQCCKRHAKAGNKCREGYELI